MVEKKDWEGLKKRSEEELKIAEMGIEQFKAQIDLCNKKLKEFPEEDPKPEGVDEILK